MEGVDLGDPVGFDAVEPAEAQTDQAVGGRNAQPGAGYGAPKTPGAQTQAASLREPIP